MILWWIARKYSVFCSFLLHGLLTSYSHHLCTPVPVLSILPCWHWSDVSNCSFFWPFFFTLASLPLPQIPHRGTHLAALSISLLHRNHSAFFPSEGSLSSSWKGEQNCPAAASGERGRLPNNLCSFGIQTHSLWWSEFSSSWQQFQRWPLAPHSSAKEGCWQGPWLCEGGEWEPTGSTIP